MTEKIPVSFNTEDLARIKELANLMGIAGVYGDNPKSIKFGIKLALAAIKSPEKVESALELDEIDIYFQSRARHMKRLKAEQEANKILENARKV